MLAAKELSTLFSVLGDGERSFDVIATRFVKAFSRPNQFKVRFVNRLCALLRRKRLVIGAKLELFCGAFFVGGEDEISLTSFASRRFGREFRRLAHSVCC